MKGILFLTFMAVGPVLAYAQKDTTVRAGKDTVPMLKKDTVSAKVSVLGQVTVTGKRPLTEQKVDRLIINVDAAVTNAGATALEVLEKSPGVTVDKDGNISLKGKQGVLVMLDGKPTYLSGADLTNLLSSMNANQLDQIEIMTNPPAKYDAAGHAGVINIKTKKNKARGFNGSLTTGFGQGKYWKTNSSLNLNYRNDAYNLFLNYSFSDNRGFTDLHIMRRYLAVDGKTVNAIFDEPTYLNRKIANNNLKLGMDYFLSKRTTLGIVATGFISPRDFFGGSRGYLQDAGGHTDSITYTTSLNNSRVVNGAVNLNLRHSFDSAHELTADADYIRYTAANAQLYGNTTNYPDGTLANANELKGDLPSTIDIWSGKMDYSQTLRKGLKLDGGWKSSLVETRNAANYFNREGGPGSGAPGGAWLPDYGKTNDFSYRENINALYLNLSREAGKWSFQGGLRYENTNYTGHQQGNPQKPDSSFSHQYNSLFPTGFISWQADKNDQFTLSAGRRIDRPAYQDLNPFLFFINQYTYSEGNPFLRPQYTTNIELSHIFRGVLTTTLNCSNTEGYFTDLFRTEGDTTIFSQGNLGRQRNAGLSVNAQIEAASWWSVTLHGDLSYKKVDGAADGAEIRTEGVNAQFNANNQFRFKKGWAAELSGYYNSRDVDGQFRTQPFGQVSAGVSRQLLNNKATVRLNVQDIFLTQVIDGAITYQNVREHFIQKRDSRVANIAFVWRFGKSLNPSPVRRGKGSADEEQNRVKL